jgi:hypothetical protein
MATTTAGRFVGAYRLPATPELQTVLATVRDGNYFDQVSNLPLLLLVSITF